MEEENEEVAIAVQHLLDKTDVDINGTNQNGTDQNGSDQNGSDQNGSDHEEEEEDEEVAMEIVKDDECIPARLVIAGFDDENEEIVQMTIEEACNYVISKVESFIRDPNINPLLLLKTQITMLEEKIKTKNEEFTKLNKMFDALYRDQVKFLRYIGVIPKVDSKTVGVSVDLPWLPETVSGIIREDLMKKSSENRSVLANSSGTNTGDADAAAKRAKKESGGPIECIDLTDDDVTVVPASKSTTSTPSASTTPSTKPSLPTPDLLKNTSITITPINPSQNSAPTTGAKPNASGPSTTAAKPNDLKHPAPLPAVPPSTDASEVLPKPDLGISSDKNGIVLQWDYPPEIRTKKIMGYEIVGYQEKSSIAPSLTLWKKIGCVSPMPLPMSCTLTQFVEGYRYHFAIRALNKDCKPGHFSNPATIMFSSNAKNRNIS